ncbi:hypothetical protein [Burkholderia territorii]|uniref:hypothetical protein n=1 Tax=Burkholderia territorii TaxID=1503055 RepID=UPI000AF7B7D3|nr:hypothetical protein [Burkholderia territorii]TXG07847.1 hypothetical protein FU139_24470 [Burkholderia territorii]HDR8858162.1 hypothetical protein [Burkholderia territorii]HDR8862845.1 hypothetical protein [Burkholderia territorii]HDR8871162.1 hypothetical protein [Burkholderia territorii]HDR8875051.1 hypothetical protein [Burkholderia territorii]
MDLSEAERSALHTNDDTGKRPFPPPLSADQLGKRWAWAFRIAWLALIGVVYIIGYLYRADYFALFHFDAEAFPIATPEYFVRGGYAIYLAASDFLNIEGDGWWARIRVIFIVAVAIGGYLAAVSIVVEWISLLIPKDKAISKAADQLKRTLNDKFQKKLPVKLGMSGVMAVVVGAYFFVSICTIAVFVYAIPSAIAEAAARRQYHTTLDGFGNGCKDPEARHFCFAVQDSTGATLARGFVIGSAPEYVALSDNGRTRVVSLQGRQLVQLDMPLKE